MAQPHMAPDTPPLQARLVEALLVQHPPPEVWPTMAMALQVRLVLARLVAALVVGRPPPAVWLTVYVALQAALVGVRLVARPPPGKLAMLVMAT